MVILQKLGLAALAPQPDVTRFSNWWYSAVRSVPKELKKGPNSLIILVAWEILKHRNACVFEGCHTLYPISVIGSCL